VPESIDQDLIHHIDGIIDHALNLPPAERETYIETACQGQEQLRPMVDSMLSKALEVLDSKTAAAEAAAFDAQALGRALAAGLFLRFLRFDVFTDRSSCPRGGVGGARPARERLDGRPNELAVAHVRGDAGGRLDCDHGGRVAHVLRVRPPRRPRDLPGTKGRSGRHGMRPAPEGVRAPRAAHRPCARCARLLRAHSTPSAGHVASAQRRVHRRLLTVRKLSARV